MELPKKIEIIEENYTAYIPEIVNIAETVNNLISYLESQKEGGDGYNVAQKLDDCAKGALQDFIDSNEEEPNCTCYTDNVGGNCKWCREEPKGECICKYTSGHHTKCPAWVDEGVMKKYVPQEPREVDVEALLRWRKEELIDTFKQALQQ